jgi:DNA repair protein RAD16
MLLYAVFACCPAGKGRVAMQLLRNTLLPAILLRRTKLQCADDLALPPR